jgi:RNA polymerase sigma-70 factor, ECF subfamily
VIVPAVAGDSGANSEPSLAERLLQGDEAALREAYLAHRPALLRFARRLLGDAAAAHDLVHEVFVRLPRVVRRLRPGASLEGFLIAVALNHARHHVRSAARRRRAQTRLAQEPHRQPAGAPDEELERRRLALALSSALDRLPIDQRVAFVLCAVEERTSADAAALAGTTESNMRARLFHARRKLREHLAGYHDGGGS